MSTATTSKNFKTIPIKHFTMLSNAYDPKQTLAWQNHTYYKLQRDTFIPNQDLYYMRIPKMFTYHQAYVSEQGIAFEKNHRTIQESLPYYWMIFDRPLDMSFHYPNTIWNTWLKKFYLRKYNYTNILANLCVFRHSMKPAFRSYEKRVFGEKNTLHKTYDFPALLWFDAYYSTFGDYMETMLPRLKYALETMPPQQKENLHILLPPINHPSVPHNYFSNYIKPTLDVYGIDQYKTLHLNLGTLHQFTKLYVPSRIDSFDPTYTLPMWEDVKNYYIKDSIKEKFQSYTRIFIDRNPKKTQTRQIINRSDVMNVLDKYQFKTIFIDDYSLQDAINLLQNVQYMIAVDSSAATNFLFTNYSNHPKLLRLSFKFKPNIEPLSDFDLRLTFRNLAYDVLLCDTVGEDWYHSNLSVNTTDLENKLKFLINTP